MNQQFIEALSSFQKNNERIAQAINSHIENITKTHQVMVKAFENNPLIYNIDKISPLPKSMMK